MMQQDTADSAYVKLVMRQFGARRVYANKYNASHIVKCKVSRKQSVGIIETLQAEFGTNCFFKVNPEDTHTHEQRITVLVRLPNI